MKWCKLWNNFRRQVVMCNQTYPAFEYFPPPSPRITDQLYHSVCKKTHGGLTKQRGRWTDASQVMVSCPGETLILLSLQFFQNTHHRGTLPRDYKHRRGPDHTHILSFSLPSREEFWMTLKADMVLAFPTFKLPLRKLVIHKFEFKISGVILNCSIRVDHKKQTSWSVQRSARSNCKITLSELL